MNSDGEELDDDANEIVSYGDDKYAYRKDAVQGYEDEDERHQNEEVPDEDDNGDDDDYVCTGTIDING